MNFNQFLIVFLMSYTFYRFYKQRKIRDLFFGSFFGLGVLSTTSYYTLVSDNLKAIMGGVIVLPALIFILIELIYFIKSLIKKDKGVTK